MGGNVRGERLLSCGGRVDGTRLGLSRTAHGPDGTVDAWYTLLGAAVAFGLFLAAFDFVVLTSIA